MPHTNSHSGQSTSRSHTMSSFPLPVAHFTLATPARDRKASRSGKKPAFLQKKKSKATPSAKDSILGTATVAAAEPTADPSIPKGRQDQTQLIRRFHTIEKQLASPALTDPDERKRLLAERETLGGLETYQAASVHGGDKARRPPSCLGQQVYRG